MNKFELQGLHHWRHLTKHGIDQSRLEGLQELASSLTLVKGHVLVTKSDINLALPHQQ
jgi:hypothetical protein